MDKFNEITAQIKKHDYFIIMAHKSIDLDAFGSAICLYHILTLFEKKVAILMAKKQENDSINKSISMLEKNNIKIEYIYEDTSLLKRENTMVFVLDTNKKELAESMEILNLYEDLFVIDHHIAGENAISASFSYIDNSVSSTAEILTHYLKYLGKTVPSVISTILLAGLVIDTNNFNIKTTDKTYDTAAFLMKMGADNVEKQQLLKEDKETYLIRQKFVKNSYMINEKIALCVLDKHKYKRHDLALIAEDLLQFDNVEASFAIGYLDKRLVGISARSIGEIDVEKYMRAMGGGGHKSDAACTIKTSNLEKVRRRLVKQIKK